jgi:cephalosporin hydroxylase
MALNSLYSYTGIPKESSVDFFAEVMEKHGSDKSTGHNYHKVYSALFNDLDSVKNIFEVGIAGGSSLRAWKEIFPSSEVFGVDLNISHLIQEDRVHSFWADQGDPATFDSVKVEAGIKEVDLIVDDGSHQLKHSMDTFSALLPWLSVNGWIVIEDIHFSMKEDWLEFQKNVGPEYKTLLLDMMNECKSGWDDNIVFLAKRIK